MKPAPFSYHRPETANEAAELLNELGEDAKILAGGQSLVPMLSLRLAYFDHLIDISRLDELSGITRNNGTLRIGATATHAAVGANAAVAQSVPLLHRATPLIGHFQIRNRGTFGGSIAHADPAGEFPAIALLHDASMEAVSPTGRRQIPAGGFFTGLWETALEPDEVLAAVEFNVWDGRCGYGVREFARRHGDFAIAGAAVAVQVDAGVVSRCAIGLLGLGSTPRRATAAEAAVVRQRACDVKAEDIGELAMSGLDDIPADLQGSADYRRRVGATVTAQAWTVAITEALNA